MPARIPYANRCYEDYNEILPDFLASASIVASRYPLRPTVGLRTLRRYINNEYVPCDADTIILRRGPVIFGWKNERWIAALFQCDAHHGFIRVIYDEELQAHSPVSLAFLISMGVGGEAPPVAEKNRSVASRILRCFGPTCRQHNTREDK